MFKKLVKKLAIAATLVCMATAVAATAAACNVETDHPEIMITVEFNSVTYKLEYKLYRNMYPNTVRHFIELTEKGVYNNVLIHDYRSSDWLSGGYEYNAEDYTTAAESEAEGAFVDYLVNHSVEEKYMELFEAGALTPTVYSDSKFNDKGKQLLVKDSALPTLIGEFANNNHKIKKGELYAEMGTLKMYYYEKETTNKVHVTPTDDQIMWNYDYKNNCATSIFSMQVGSSSSISASKYCVFGKMESTKALASLINAVSDYYADNDAVSIDVDDVPVDNLVEIFSSESADRGTEQDFTLPALPIIIKSVKVTKY